MESLWGMRGASAKFPIDAPHPSWEMLSQKLSRPVAVYSKRI